ncbi:MAG TPA: cytochrome P450 [Candidatus Binatia bacterium]|jgi:cytochrome P450
MTETERLELGRIFIDPKAYADEKRWHAAAATLRREDPVHLVEMPGFDPFWAVMRHEHVIEIERQHEKFWNTVESVLMPSAAQEQRDAIGVPIKTLVHMDGAEHRAYRAVTHDWFKPANLKRLVGERVDGLARDFVDKMESLGGRCDFAREISFLYPIRVIMEILGVPYTDEPRMLQLTQQLFGNEDGEFSGTDDRIKAILDSLMDFAMYFSAMTADRREHPKSDLASTIANGKINGEPMGDLETASYYTIAATAGHDTTSNSLAAGMELFARHPDQLRIVQDDMSLIENAVDEIIRFATPVRHFLRHAQEDYELGGKKIKKGDRLYMAYLSANRDESVFEDPFRFDVQRRNADEHLAFGIGVHFCLGSHLARMELRAFFRELLPRLESVELDGTPQYVLATFVGGPKNVPIRYRMRPVDQRREVA